MSAQPWASIELDDGSRDLSTFSCGLASVDNWIHRSPRPSRHLVATHLCCDGQGNVIAFFTLTYTALPTADLPTSRLRRNAPKQGNSVGILLAQMGVDRHHQGHGMGKAVVLEAMRAAASIHAMSPFQLFLVDAENASLIDFYTQFHFTHIPGTLRLAAPMVAVSKMLDLLHS